MKEKSFISMGFTHLGMIFTSRPMAAVPDNRLKPFQNLWFLKVSQLPVFATDTREEANLFCLMEFVNPNFNSDKA